MSLADIQIETETVQLGHGVSVTLSPLSMEDVVGLLQDRGSFIGETIAEFATVLEKPECQMAFASRMMSRAAPFVAALIAISAGEPEAVDKVASLPMGMQTQLFTVALKLTLANNEPAEVFSELVLAIAPMAPLLSPPTRH